MLALSSTTSGSSSSGPSLQAKRIKLIEKVKVFVKVHNVNGVYSIQNLINLLEHLDLAVFDDRYRLKVPILSFQPSH